MPPSYSISAVDAVDLSKPDGGSVISTGVGFLDHMIDQLNSHAQVGVSAVVASSSSPAPTTDKNRYSDPPEGQAEIMSLVGSGLGSKIGALIKAKGVTPDASSRFCCPLDEALVECVLSAPAGGGVLSAFELAPYGVYPAGKGRSRIGRMSTGPLDAFFGSVAEGSGLDVSLRKVRGDNGHHVVESAFKAFSRALRNLLDGTTTDSCEGEAFESTWGATSESKEQGLAMNRCAKLERSTKETSISVDLKLDGGKDGVRVDTGLPALDDIFTTLANEAQMSLGVECRGDTWVDDHHTAEDVSIALGQCLDKALGTKAGLNRMWCAVGVVGDAEVEVTMDLSNRPCLTSDLSLSTNANEEEYVEGDLTVEMLVHSLESLVENSRMTVHIVERKEGKKVKETAMAAAMAFGRALKMCSAVDPRRAGKTASSKGTLSV
eukprot:CAMPEP_0183319440 /NCGR_PEP_ID=MMETSP0160_2-20130417/63677_1 /TAXON_ID=2839 ORGANISM="Odontella Sinensis, Strain Grunow 1884" /NCGR_SAMPLE_ID=MMETSP0160_2 /ASSEMBLY_ACC=CAM_ASM_000250 /LENGTH=433 /DNA_ID=CAMNT_0025485921 /DNA_START=45 /DNA_END=1346 /DNA_ORIENTATION=+